MSFDTPILFLVFNRPDTTKRVFQRIKEMQPARLFIGADGPRGGKEGEKEKCEAVRKLILDGIDWSCDVKTLFRESNLGCGRAVSGAITWFFENVEEGIILEDDTLPDSTFFTFCTILLDTYRRDDKVKMISGNNFQSGKRRGDGSYYFSAYGHIWGWASWRRTWNEYDFTLSKISANDLDKYLLNYFSEKPVFDYWKKIFQQLKERMINTWDYQLLFSMWRMNGVSILPNQNLVTNIGFGEGSTHTKNANDKTSEMPVTPINKIIHPMKKIVDREADRFFFKNYIENNPSFLQRFKNRLLRIK